MLSFPTFDIIMKNHFSKFFAVIFTLLMTQSFSAFTQEKVDLLLLGGQIFSGKYIQEDSMKISIKITTKKGKSKVVDVDKDRLFSYTKEGKETVLYTSSTSDYGYSVEDMRYYIRGQQDAQKYHKIKVPFIVSTSVSAVVAGYLGSQSSSLIVLTPIIGTVAGTITKRNFPKVNAELDPELVKHNSYMDGYKKAARGKKIIRSISGAIVGTIVGSTVGLIIANNS